jgi:hypothetical protein
MRDSVIERDKATFPTGKVRQQKVDKLAPTTSNVPWEASLSGLSVFEHAGNHGHPHPNTNAAFISRP